MVAGSKPNFSGAKKKLDNNVKIPNWRTQKKKPEITPGKVTITSIIHGWCTYCNVTHQRFKNIVKEYDNKVIFNEVDTLDKHNMNNWGITDAIFIDKKEIKTIPPLKNEKIHKLIQKQIKKIAPV